MIATICLIATLLLTASSQILQKRAGMKLHSATAGFGQLPRQVEFWLALMLAGCGMLSWLIVLSNWPVGVAYPLLSLNFVVVLFASRYLFGERISARAKTGTVLIACGTLLIAGGGF